MNVTVVLLYILITAFPSKKNLLEYPIFGRNPLRGHTYVGTYIVEVDVHAKIQKVIKKYPTVSSAQDVLLLYILITAFPSKQNLLEYPIFGRNLLRGHTYVGTYIV